MCFGRAGIGDVKGLSLGLGLSSQPVRAAAGGGGGPSFVSATGYVTGTSDVGSWTPFTGLDLSNCDMAVFILSRDGGVLTTGDTTASSGWARLNYSTSSGGAITSAIFYKVAPTASEELAITFDAAGEQASGILIRANGVDAAESAGDQGDSTNAAPPTLEEFDPPLDALAIAAATWDSVITASAGPSGYSNLTTQAASGVLGASTAIATKLIPALVAETPGAFTSDTEQWVAWTIALYLA